MPPVYDPSSLSADIQELQKQMRLWTQGIRWFFVSLIAIVGSMAIRALASASQFRMLYADMLGSMDKLSPLTRMVVEHSTAIMGLVGGLMLLACGLILLCRNPRTVWIGALVALLVLILSTTIIYNAMVSPLVTIIAEMGKL